MHFKPIPQEFLMNIKVSGSLSYETSDVDIPIETPNKKVFNIRYYSFKKCPRGSKHLNIVQSFECMHFSAELIHS